MPRLDGAGFEITRVSHLVVDPSKSKAEEAKILSDIGDSGSCNIDFKCSPTPQDQVTLFSLFADALHGIDVRFDQSAAPDAQDVADFAGTGLTPVGDILFVNDNYLNLDQRTVQGWDFGLYYDLDDTPLGDFSFKLNAALLDKFFQGVSPNGSVINAAAAAGAIPGVLRVNGQGDLVRNFGRPEWRYTSSLTWRKDAWSAGWFTSYVGDVEDKQIVLTSTSQPWIIDDFQTHNLYVQYEFDQDSDKPMRLRLGMRNIFDEVPPLADTNFGYLGDLHNPQGRFVYVNVRKTF